MIKKIIGICAITAILLVPATSYGAAYHFINLRGDVVTIEASSAADALAQVRARGDVMHSGIKYDQGLLESGQSFGTRYGYIDMYGNTRYVVAASLNAAYTLATDKAPHSGMMILEDGGMIR